MSPEHRPQVGEKELVVRRGRVGSVDLYEIKENELELLEKGSPANLQLNFSVFLFSLAFSAIAALATAEFKQQLVQTVFIFVAVIGIILGGYLLISWWRTRNSIGELVNTIRDRIPPDVDSASRSEIASNLPSSEKNSSG